MALHDETAIAFDLGVQCSQSIKIAFDREIRDLPGYCLQIENS